MIIDAVAGRCGGNTPSDGQHRMRLRAGLRSESTIRPRSSRGWAGNGQLQAVLCARGQPRYVAWLSLAAAPVSAAMAVPAVFTANPSDMLCSAIHGASPLSGMVPMYLLMSAFRAGGCMRLMPKVRRPNDNSL